MSMVDELAVHHGTGPLENRYALEHGPGIIVQGTSNVTGASSVGLAAGLVRSSRRASDFSFYRLLRVPCSTGSSKLPWIQVAPDVPYFCTDAGASWTPIGQNDAVTWPELAGLFRRRDLAGAEAHLRWLGSHGVTCLRLMLEYSHGEHRYFERPVGRFQPNMVQLWDDLFALCERVGMRLLLTPFDTYFTWVRWRKHPYNVANGGPCEDRTQLLVCRATREAVKRRLAFATDRWGASGVLFGWDLWNELHPAQGDYRFDELNGFVEEVGGFLRALEIRLHGRAHPQTVSVFGPELVSSPELNALIFRHPALDFANSHFYEKGTIDDPRDTVAPALAAGRLTREALAQVMGGRPFFDSEHGPIHAFKDRHRILPEPFDDEYFRHIQWAHFASGGAGGGMRWPNRHPHVLTAGMRRAQRALAEFLPLIDWPRFRRSNLNKEVELSTPAVAAFACGDEEQAVLWLLRRDATGEDGMLRSDLPALEPRARIPGLRPGRYRVVAWDTGEGAVSLSYEARTTGEVLALELPPVHTDLAFAIRRLND